MVADGFFEFLKEKSFLDEFSEFGVVGIEKSDEDGVRVDLRRGGGGGGVVRECRVGIEWEKEEEEEGEGDTIDGRRIHGASWRERVSFVQVLVGEVKLKE